VATEPVASLRTREYDALRSLIREVRESKGISQEELSRQMGRPITFVGKIEMGTRRLDVIELMEIAKVLDVDIVRFVTDLSAKVAHLGDEASS